MAARPVALRDANTYSVILGRFFNEGYGQHVTLAQVFWLKDAEGQPARLYVRRRRGSCPSPSISPTSAPTSASCASACAALPRVEV